MNHAEMSSKELLDVLNDIDEQDWLEAKSLRDDTSRSILETVCSFSDEPGLGGGVILIGVAENKTGDGPQYFVEGVDDPDKAQLDLATQCKSVFNTPIYPTIKVEKIDGKAVLKVVVDEQPFGRKPVYFKKDGLPKGAYRQLTGCKPKLVAKELTGIKDQGLMIQKGRTRGTYYVPAGSLEEGIEEEKRKLISQAQVETTTPRAVTGTPSSVTGTPQAVMSTARGVMMTPQAVMSTARSVMMTPRQGDIPDVLQKKIAALKRRVPGKVMQSVIVELCAVRAMGRIELSKILKRSPVTIDRLVAPLIGKELDYLYPMMPHHPRQAYVALGNDKS